MTQAGNGRAHLAGELAMVEAEVSTGDDEPGGPGVLAQVADLGPAVRGEREHRDGTQPEQRDAQHQQLDRIGQLHHDPVPGPQAQRVQARGPLVRTQVEAGIADPLAAGGHRRATAPRAGRAAQQSGECLVRPVAVPPVPPDEPRRPGTAPVSM